MSKSSKPNEMPADYSRLALTLHKGSSIWIGPVRMEWFHLHLQRAQARIALDAPVSVPIWRDSKLEEATGFTDAEAYHRLGPCYLEWQIPTDQPCQGCWVRSRQTGRPTSFATVDQATAEVMAHGDPKTIYRICHLITGRVVSKVYKGVSS
jgi:hypothetical protein